MQRKTKWWLAAGLIGIPIAGGLTLLILAKKYSAQIEPYIKDQAVEYLRDRFNAEVQIGSLRIDVPALSPMKMYVSKGRGVIAAVQGTDINLKKDGKPLFSMKSMRFEVDVGAVMEPDKAVQTVYLDGVEIIIPPKGQRPKLSTGPPSKDAKTPNVVIRQIYLSNAKLIIQPKDPKRVPLEFELHRVRLDDAGLANPMKYEAELRNAKPPGEIHSTGHFGPWDKDDPGSTPLDGDYKFERANLGVFNAIGGVLNSTGTFQGSLSEIYAKGEATVPDFYLKAVGNKLPLRTTFEVEVDGTNGNTILKPVHGTLGKTSFVTSGGVVKHDGDPRRTIALDVNMPAGRLEDVLLLAMKGNEPFMSGLLQMNSKIMIPPLSGKVIEKLQLDGRFTIRDAKFLRSQMQDRIDKMSRQAQGEPENEAIDEVVSGMSGKFRLADKEIALHELAFGIPGAALRLDGTYDLGSEELDFHGDLRLDAKLSQTQTGWKRWALKPVDPFFAKNGAGLYTKIKITGTRKEPKFGRDK